MADLTLTPELKKFLKAFAKETRTHIEALASRVREELIAQKGVLDLFHNRLLILERQAATFPNGAIDHDCGCGHPRGSHAGQSAEGGCCSNIVVGDPTDPKGERKYAPCICEKFTPASLIIAPNRG